MYTRNSVLNIGCYKPLLDQEPILINSQNIFKFKDRFVGAMPCKATSCYSNLWHAVAQVKGNPVYE